MNILRFLVFLGILYTQNYSKDCLGSVTVTSIPVVQHSYFTERTFGDPQTAPVTITMYFSPSCGHCAHIIHTEIPNIIAKYVNTKKICLIIKGVAFYPTDVPIFFILSSFKNHQTSWDYLKRFLETQEAWLAQLSAEEKKTSEGDRKNKNKYEKILEDIAFKVVFEQAKQFKIKKTILSKISTLYEKYKKYRDHNPDQKSKSSYCKIDEKLTSNQSHVINSNNEMVVPKIVFKKRGDPQEHSMENFSEAEINKILDTVPQAASHHPIAAPAVPHGAPLHQTTASPVVPHGVSHP